jgi:SAM-dependent methyltransferase
MSTESDSSAHIVIDEHITILEGDAAIASLATKNDAARVNSQRGIVTVETARWQEAQRYERRTWMEHGRLTASDRNESHAERFARYCPLRGRRFVRGIELGCGPFTNLRLILEECQIDDIYLLDPLITDYASHPFCRYRGGRLGGLLRLRLWSLALLVHPTQFVHLVRNAYRVGRWTGRRVTLIPAMIEAFQPNVRFDLVVMVNVLEHCQDAEAVLAKIVELLEPGGVLVYHDRMYRAADLQRLMTVLYDAGHPLRVDQSVIEEFLTRHFEALSRAEYFTEQEFHGLRYQDTSLYYTGIKRPAT